MDTQGPFIQGDKTPAREKRKSQELLILLTQVKELGERNEVTYIFYPPDAQAILTIPLRASARCDVQAWQPERHGKFTVRSAYHHTMERISPSPDQQDGPSSLITHREALWKAIWKVKTSSKINVFQSSIRGSFRAIWFNFIESLKQSSNIHII